MRTSRTALLIMSWFFFYSSFVLCPQLASAESITASWYGPGFEHRTMADGKRFRSADPTVAAHRTLPFGTRVLLTNPATGNAITVTVQDRGPYIRGRDFDLSKAAARALGYERQGVAVLEVEYLDAEHQPIEPATVPIEVAEPPIS